MKEKTRKDRKYLHSALLSLHLILYIVLFLTHAGLRICVSFFFGSFSFSFFPVYAFHCGRYAVFAVVVIIISH